MCSHRNLAAYALAKNHTHGIGRTTRVLLASAITFDPCLGDVAATVVSGERCVRGVVPRFPPFLSVFSFVFSCLGVCFLGLST